MTRTAGGSTPRESAPHRELRPRRRGALRGFLSSRGFAIGGPVAVVILAAILRLQGLGHPAVLMFDETYYVKDAWTLLNLGYEGSWPKDSDAGFAAGDVQAFLPQASYPAHPPLGKWLVGLGMLALGVTDPASWRLSVAVAGILGVILLMLIAHSLWRQSVLTVLAGGLFAIDGHAIVLSRLGLLDNFVMLFTLSAVGALLLDRGATARRLDRKLEARRAAVDAREMRWGPVVWWRPWLLVAGIALGLGTSVKWSGLYFLAILFVYVVASDALARRRRGLPFWPLAAVLKQGPVNALLVLPAAVAVYLASWTGWFVTSGGYDRDWIASGGARWTGALGWVPDALQNLWHWHASIYAFHNGLSTPHPYSTPAILWPLLVRPTQIHFRASTAGENGCGWTSCTEMVWSTANPVLWWAANLAALYVLYRFLRFAEWRFGLVLIGIAAGYLPWLLYPSRTMFQFYAIAYEPYLILCLMAVIGALLGIPIGERTHDNLVVARGWLAQRRADRAFDPDRDAGSDAGAGPDPDPDSDPEPDPDAGPDPVPAVPSAWASFVSTVSRPAVRARFVVVFLVLVVLVSAFFYPLWTGAQVPFWFWTIHIWLPTWV